MQTALKIFAGLGGVALIWIAAKNGVPKAIDWAFEKALTYPAFRAFVVANKDSIKEILAESEKLISEDIDQAANEKQP